MNYTNFTQYVPTDAQPATIYWISKEGMDWRVVKEMLSQDSRLTVLLYNDTGRIELASKDLTGIIPTVKSILIVDLTTLLIEGDIQTNYLIKGGQLERLNLEAIYAEKWEQVKEIRTAKMNDGVFLQSIGKWFHTDLYSKQQIQALVVVNIIGMYKTTAWKTLDNTYVQLTPALLIQLFGAMLENESRLFGIGKLHYDMLHTSPDPSNYDPTSQWPTTFSDL